MEMPYQLLNGNVIDRARRFREDGCTNADMLLYRFDVRSVIML